MNLGIISRYVGIALMCNAFFMGLSAFVSACNGYDSAFSPLLLSGIITGLVGVFPLIFVRKRRDINTREGILILLSSWFLSCLFGMLPYVLWGGEFSIENAWFESASGITTTGATCLTDIEALPRGLLFWRSSTHYIGGLGVVVFIMMILPSFGSVRFRMSKMEVMDVARGNYRYKSNEYVKVVVTVYLGITITCLLLLLMAGLPFFEAINTTFSTVATGGFSTKNLSIAAYNSFAVELIVMVFMVISTLHFGLIYASVVTGTPKVLKNPVTKFYLATILVSSLLIAGNLLTSGISDSLSIALRLSFFEVISTMSTSGFAIADTSGWPIFSIFILMYGAIQCGCSGSTTSGVRSDRIMIVFQAVKAQLVKMAHPNAVVQIKSGDQIVDRDLTSSVLIFVLIYAFVTFVFAMVYSLFGWPLIDVIGTSISMMSNVGPGFGEAFGSMSTYAEAPVVAKVFMGFQMIIGRLGFYSVLLIFTLFRKRA